MSFRKKLFLPLGLAGFSVGAGLVGKAFGSQGLESSGAAVGKFISPAMNIVVGGAVINLARQIKLR
jgi:hypothetical protein